MSWVVYPLIQGVSRKILPLKSWYPVDVKSSPWYEIVYIFQAFGQFFIGTGKPLTCRRYNLECKMKIIKPQATESVLG